MNCPPDVLAINVSIKGPSLGSGAQQLELLGDPPRQPARGTSSGSSLPRQVTASKSPSGGAGCRPQGSSRSPTNRLSRILFKHRGRPALGGVGDMFPSFLQGYSKPRWESRDEGWFQNMPPVLGRRVGMSDPCSPPQGLSSLPIAQGMTPQS